MNANTFLAKHFFSTDTMLEIHSAYLHGLINHRIIITYNLLVWPQTGFDRKPMLNQFMAQTGHLMVIPRKIINIPLQ
jgi:hypothetical protein